MKNLIERLRRSPHGERGLKYFVPGFIERDITCRSPHGERGLKLSRPISNPSPVYSRSPHGERGLKCLSGIPKPLNKLVAPHTGSVDLLTRVFFYPTLEHCTLTSTGYRYLFCNGQTSSQAWTYIAFRARLFLLSISSCLRWLAISML